MSEDSTIRQEIVLEDKVTPALDSILKSIQGTTTAMGELLASVSRFQNAASQGGFNINFEQTADAVRNISDAYENAVRHAQGLSDVASNIQVAAPIPASVSNPAVSAIQPDALPVATSSPTASANIPTGLEQLNAEYSNLKGQLSSIFQEIAANAQSRFASMTAPARQVFQDIALTAQIQMSNVRAEVERFVAPARQAFQNLALNAKIRFASMTASARQAFSNIALSAQIRFSSIQSRLSAVANGFKTRFGPAFHTIGRIGGTTAQLIGNRFKAAFEMARGGLSRFQNMMRSTGASVPRESGKGSSGGMAGGLGGMLGGGLGKLALIGGVATAAVAGFKQLADTASQRTVQINSLNAMSEEKRNGLKGDEIQDYGVKYANRIGMSADDFTAQSIKLLQTTDAFGSVGEAMNFNELLQKQLKVSGVDAEGANMVTEMYSRGLMKGFDTREIRTIMEEAPALADALAEAANVENPAELLSKAGKGKITAQVAKDAIFGNADDIETQFASTPKTMNELFEKLKNSAAQALDPISQKITDIANKPETQAFVDRLIEGMTWFSEIAGEAFEIVTNAIGTVAPYVEEAVVPIKEIISSVWDMIKGLIDDITEMFTKDEEFGKSAQGVWTDFKIVLERIKPIVEGIIQTIAGGIKILIGSVKNIITLAENARTWLHNKVSGEDEQLEYKSFDTDVFVDAAEQMAEGYTSAWKESAALTKDIWTKNLKPIPKSIESEPENNPANSGNDDRIQVGITPTKPLHVKQVGKTKIDKESLQLLKELAQAEIINRVNNIQPAITANFGDVHETADVDAMLDRLEKDVVSARGQNLMLQTGMQYAL